ncbi:MAG: hypothetical protein R2867_21190 [Caldilineaceae bacterium]
MSSRDTTQPLSHYSPTDHCPTDHCPSVADFPMNRLLDPLPNLLGELGNVIIWLGVDNI